MSKIIFDKSKDSWFDIRTSAGEALNVNFPSGVSIKGRREFTISTTPWSFVSEADTSYDVDYASLTDTDFSWGISYPDGNVVIKNGNGSDDPDYTPKALDGTEVSYTLSNDMTLDGITLKFKRDSSLTIDRLAIVAEGALTDSSMFQGGSPIYITVKLPYFLMRNTQPGGDVKRYMANAYITQRIYLDGDFGSVMSGLNPITWTTSSGVSATASTAQNTFAVSTVNARTGDYDKIAFSSSIVPYGSTQQLPAFYATVKFEPGTTVQGSIDRSKYAYAGLSQDMTTTNPVAQFTSGVTLGFKLDADAGGQVYAVIDGSEAAGIALGDVTQTFTVINYRSKVRFYADGLLIHTTDAPLLKPSQPYRLAAALFDPMTVSITGGEYYNTLLDDIVGPVVSIAPEAPAAELTYSIVTGDFSLSIPALTSDLGWSILNYRLSVRPSGETNWSSITIPYQPSTITKVLSTQERSDLGISSYVTYDYRLDIASDIVGSSLAQGVAKTVAYSAPLEAPTITAVSVTGKGNSMGDLSFAWSQVNPAPASFSLVIWETYSNSINAQYDNIDNSATAFVLEDWQAGSYYAAVRSVAGDGSYVESDKYYNIVVPQNYTVSISSASWNETTKDLSLTIYVYDINSNYNSFGSIGFTVKNSSGNTIGTASSSDNPAYITISNVNTNPGDVKVSSSNSQDIFADSTLVTPTVTGTNGGGGGGGGGGGNNGGNGHNMQATLEFSYTGYTGSVSQTNTITVLGEEGGVLSGTEIVVDVTAENLSKCLLYSSNWTVSGDEEGEQPLPKVIFRPGAACQSALNAMSAKLSAMGTGAAGSAGRKFTDDDSNDIAVFGDVLLGLSFTDSALDDDELPREAIRAIDEGAITATALDVAAVTLASYTGHQSYNADAAPLLEGLFEQAVSAGKVLTSDVSGDVDADYKRPTFVSGDKISFLVKYDFQKKRAYVLDGLAAPGNTADNTKTITLTGAKAGPFSIPTGTGAEETSDPHSETYIITLRAA